MQNRSEIAEFLWKIADPIKDDYEAKDHEDVILPLTLLRSFDKRFDGHSCRVDLMYERPIRDDGQTVGDNLTKALEAFLRNPSNHR